MFRAFRFCESWESVRSPNSETQLNGPSLSYHGLELVIILEICVSTEWASIRNLAWRRDMRHIDCSPNVEREEIVIEL